VKPLRQAKHLSVVETRLYENKGPLGENPELLGKRKAWKAGLIDVLKNSPSEDRKFLIWNLIQVYQQPTDGCYVNEAAETEELEVFPEPSP